MTDFYVFLDLETTGLDPLKDQIMEVAWRVTDDKFRHVGPWGRMLAQPRSWSDFYHQLNANTIARKMHEESGLLKEFYDAGDKFELIPILEVMSYLESNLSSFAANHRYDHGDAAALHLAGLSVHFDKAMLQVNGPSWWFGQDHESLFHHRMLDLSSVKMMLDCSEVPWKNVPSDTQHRAMNDVDYTIRQAKEFRAQLAEMYDDHMLVQSKVAGDL